MYVCLVVHMRMMVCGANVGGRAGRKTGHKGARGPLHTSASPPLLESHHDPGPWRVPTSQARRVWTGLLTLAPGQPRAREPSCCPMPAAADRSPVVSGEGARGQMPARELGQPGLRVLWPPAHPQPTDGVWKEGGKSEVHFPGRPPPGMFCAHTMGVGREQSSMNRSPPRRGAEYLSLPPKFHLVPHGEAGQTGPLG